VSSWQILSLDEANEKFVNGNRPTDFEPVGRGTHGLLGTLPRTAVNHLSKVAGEFFLNSQVGRKRRYGKFGRIGNGKSACVYQSIAHEKRVYREQSANPEALLPASPLSLAEFDPLR
jgi:hypothetical protein